MAQPPASQQEPQVDVAKLYVWIKSVESKVNNLLREMDVIKNEFLKKQLDLKKDAKTLSEDVLKLRQEQERSTAKMDLVIKELRQTAGVEEVLTLKKYIDLWNPLHFATQKDVERLVEQKLQLKQDSSALPEKSPGSASSEVLSDEEGQTHKKEKHLPFQ